MISQPLHNLLSIGVLALHLFFLPTQSAITPTVKSEEDLFYLLTKPVDKPVAKIDQELTEHSEFVTHRLWQWLQTHISFLITSSSPKLNIYRCVVAVRVAYRLKDAAKIAASHQRLGQQYVEAREFEKAIQEYQLSKDFFRNVGQQNESLLALSDLSYAHLLSGNVDMAKATSEEVLQAISISRATPDAVMDWIDERARAAAMTILAEIDFRAGQYKSSIAQNFQALHIYQQLNDSHLRAYDQKILDVLTDLGRDFSSSGEYQQSLIYFHRALKMARQRRNNKLEASLLHQLGVLYLRQENYDRAESYFNQSLQSNAPNSDLVMTADTTLNLGIVAYRRGDWDKALAHFQNCQTLALKLKDEDLLILASQHLGGAYHARKNLNKALFELSQSESLARKHGYRVRMIEALWRQAEVLISVNRIDEASAKAEEALGLAKQLGQPKLTHLAAVSMAKVYISRQQIQKAQQMLLLGIDTLEEMRETITGEAIGRQLFFSQRLEAFHLMVDIQVGQSNPADALLYVERAKGRSLYDRLLVDRLSSLATLSLEEQSEEKRLRDILSSLNRQLMDEQIRNRLQSPRLNELRSKLSEAREEFSSFRDLLTATKPNAALKANIPPSLSPKTLLRLMKTAGTVFLEYFVSENQTFVFTVRKSPEETPTLKVSVIQIKREDITRRATRLHQMMEQRHPAYSSEARSLYDLLLKPIEAQLQGATSLCIIPDDALWDVPFQVLQPKDGRFLLEDLPIYYAPSLSILSELAWRRESPDTFKPTSFLAFGNPVTRLETLNHLHETQTGFKFEPLPEAESEVKTIGDLFSPERRAVYIGPRASEARFKAEAANFGIIHFATHGMIDNLNPLYSYLLLASEENDGEDGLLEAREVLDLNLHADTVVLSACETARGRIGAGEGVIGMTWAFFAAGARTAIVSQWKVDSGATAELMTDFYHRFHAGADKPEAMRQAALTLLKGSRYSHPFYWASFIVVGSDR